MNVEAVGRVIDEHYRARLAADPTGPRVHECGTYCGADIAERLSRYSEPPEPPCTLSKQRQSE